MNANFTCLNSSDTYKNMKLCGTLDPIPDECFSDEISDVYRYIAGSWGVIVSMIGILGNLTTMVILCRIKGNSKGKTVHQSFGYHIFLLQIATTDMAYSILGPFLTTVHYLSKPKQLFGYQGCFAVAFLRHLLAYAEMLMVSVLALLRWLQIEHPEKFAKVMSSWKYIALIISFIWTCSFVLLGGTIFEVGTFGFNCLMGACDFIVSPHHSVWLQIYFMYTGYMVSLLLMVFSYAKVLILLRQKRRLNERRCSCNFDSQRQDMKATWTILILCASFWLFVFPAIAFDILDSVDMRVSVLHHHVASVWYWGHLCVNFILYWAASPFYRSAYVNLVSTINDRLWGLFFKLSDCSSQSDNIFLLQSPPGISHSSSTPELIEPAVTTSQPRIVNPIVDPDSQNEQLDFQRLQHSGPNVYVVGKNSDIEESSSKTIYHPETEVY